MYLLVGLVPCLHKHMWWSFVFLYLIASPLRNVKSAMGGQHKDTPNSQHT